MTPGAQTTTTLATSRSSDLVRRPGATVDLPREGVVRRNEPPLRRACQRVGATRGGEARVPRQRTSRRAAAEEAVAVSAVGLARKVKSQPEQRNSPGSPPRRGGGPPP